jgi:hypothetical protein
MLEDVLTDLFGDLPQATGWTRLMRGIEDSIKTAGGSVKPNSFHEERHDVSNEPDPPAPLEFFYKIQLARNDGDNFEIQEIAGKTDANGTLTIHQFCLTKGAGAAGR